MNKKRYKKS